MMDFTPAAASRGPDMLRLSCQRFNCNADGRLSADSTFFCGPAENLKQPVDCPTRIRLNRILRTFFCQLMLVVEAFRKNAWTPQKFDSAWGTGALGSHIRANAQDHPHFRRQSAGASAHRPQGHIWACSGCSGISGDVRSRFPVGFRSPADRSGTGHDCGAPVYSERGGNWATLCDHSGTG